MRKNKSPQGGQTVSRQAHNLEIAGSTPAPATIPKPADPKRIIPSEPPQEPHLGDRTPAFARWLRDFFPEQFKERYHKRNLELDGEIYN